jgi:hypothetical protein
MAATENFDIHFMLRNGDARDAVYGSSALQQGTPSPSLKNIGGDVRDAVYAKQYITNWYRSRYGDTSFCWHVSRQK